MTATRHQQPRNVSELRAVPPSLGLADAVAGTAWGAVRLSVRLAATGARITAPVLAVVLRPPLVPRRLQPGYGVQVMAERWQRDRPEVLSRLGDWSSAALPGAVDSALQQVDTEQVATVVLDHIDLTRIVSTLLERLDLDAVAAQVLDQIQVELLASRLIDRIQADVLAAQLISELEVDALAAQLLNQLDLTQLVLERVDLQQVVSGALAQLDLTAIVVEQVDLGDVVAAALQRVDLTAIVMSQVDLLGVAQYVVDGIDLPEIIRDSTGSVASEAVVGMRMQGIEADVIVGRIVDRMLRRRREGRAEDALDTLSAPERSGDPPVGKRE
jgi:hypothetical protein